MKETMYRFHRSPWAIGRAKRVCPVVAFVVVGFLSALSPAQVDMPSLDTVPLDASVIDRSGAEPVTDETRTDGGPTDVGAAQFATPGGIISIYPINVADADQAAALRRDSTGLPPKATGLLREPADLLREPTGLLRDPTGRTPPRSARDVATLYLVYWHDVETNDLYVYDRPVAFSAELGAAVIALEESLGVPAAAVTALSPILDQAVDAATTSEQLAADWLPVTRNRVRRIMGLQPRDEPEILHDDGGDPIVCFGLEDPPGAGGASRFARPGRGPERAGGVPRDGNGARPIKQVPRTAREAPGAEEPTIEFGCCKCVPSSGCGSDAQCSDGNECTRDDCVGAGVGCRHIKLTGQSCRSDFNSCTRDQCIDGVCRHTATGFPCDDQNVCTEGDTCVANGNSASCIGTVIECDDGNFCNGVEICEGPGGGCTPGTPPECDDGDPCNGVESCDPAAGCVAGISVECDDGNPCNGVETCSPVTGGCVPGAWLDCDDEAFCNGVESCQPFAGCVSGDPPCPPALVCDDTFDICRACLSHAECSDGNPCNGAETCDPANGCMPGMPIQCDDEDACNGVETCDPPTGDCIPGTPLDCDDGVSCTGVEWCDPAIGCVPGIPLCDDGDPCTTDHCDSDDGSCSYTPFGREHDPDAGENCAIGVSTPWGQRLFVNDDDDNGNGVADYQESDFVSGEDDLKSVSASVGSWSTPLPECTLTADEYTFTAGGSNKITAYSSSTMAGGPYSGGWPPPSSAQLYLGGNAASECPVVFSVGLVCDSTLHTCGGQSDPIDVIGVTDLRWDKADPSNLDLEPCPNNGGLRIFPGTLSPTDTQAATRREVDLVAHIQPPIAGVTVHFKVFDVDDPFDQLHGVNGLNDVADVGIIDSDTVGGDNRPTGTSDPAVRTFSATTDANGDARVTATVTMQPGNNYRAGASVLQDALVQNTQAKADSLSVTTNASGQFIQNGNFAGYDVPLVWSPMLTVWRKLHVETDSMARPTFAENTINTTWNQPRFPSGTLTLDISDQFDADHFENGFIRIEAAGFPDIVARIITFRHSVLDDEIDTSITEAQWGQRPASGSCTISDDDLGDEANFTLGVVGSDIGTGTPPNGFLPLPDTSGLPDHYGPAYILPVVEAEHTSLGAFPFVKNIENIEQPAAWNPMLPARTLVVGTSNYWTSIVFSLFQAERNEDFDGELFATKGINTHVDGATTSSFGTQYTGMCAIFVESVRDGFGEQAHRITVAHEIAHTLGVAHLGDEDTPGDGGLMDETEQGPDFLAESLKRLRDYSAP